MTTFNKNGTHLGMCVLIGLTAHGCRKESNSLSGMVTFNGQPVSRGMIAVTPNDGKGKVEGAKIENGAYTVVNLEPGSKRVTIRGLTGVDRSSASPSQEPLSSGDMFELPPNPPDDSAEIPLNAIGNDRVIEVQPGKTTQDFELRSP